MISDTAKASKNKNDFRWFWAGLNTYLVNHGLKQTSQRNQIIECFLQSATKHVSAEDLHAKIRKKHENIGLATVYRTLNLLKKAALVEQLSFVDGGAVFEIDWPDEHHDHLICLKCGRVIEFESEAIEKMQQKIAADHGFKLISHRHHLFGECSAPDCK